MSLPIRQPPKLTKKLSLKDLYYDVINYLNNHSETYLHYLCCFARAHRGQFFNGCHFTTPLAIQQPFISQYFLLCFPSSHCPQCKRALSIGDLIPLWSYYRLAGCCRYCNKPIPAKYPFIELLTCVLSLAVVFSFGFTFATLAALLLTWALIALAFIDIKHLLLPNTIIIPFIGLGLLVNFFDVFQPFYTAVLGAVTGYLSLWFIYWIYKMFTGKEGLGQGDFKFLAMLGAWLGLTYIPLIVFFSSLLGTLWGLGLMLLNKTHRNTPLPFGAFLAFGGYTVLIWGEQIIQFYL